MSFLLVSVGGSNSETASRTAVGSFFHVRLVFVGAGAAFAVVCVASYVAGLLLTMKPRPRVCCMGGLVLSATRSTRSLCAKLMYGGVFTFTGRMVAKDGEVFSSNDGFTASVC